MSSKKYPVNQDLIKDDLYCAVNEAWLKEAKIPADKSTTGGFADLAENIEKTLMADFANMADHHDVTDNPELNEFLKYYNLAADATRRADEGYQPALKYLQKIEHLTDLNDWQEQLVKLTYLSYPSPFHVSVSPDMKNTDIYTLYADVPSLILPDKTYYQNDNPNRPALLEVYRQMMMELYLKAGYDEKTATQHLDNTLNFDALLAPHQKDSTERADYVTAYNKYSIEEFIKLSDHVALDKYLEKLLHQLPAEVIVTEPKYFAALNEIINPENFELMKSWMLTKMLHAVSFYVDNDARVTAGTYGRMLSGSKEAMNDQKAAYYLASGQFDQVVGLYYAHRYFGEQARADVKAMVKKMIKIYQKRLQENDWLSENTKEKALVKLDTLGIDVGYPDKLDPLYREFKVNPQRSLLDNDMEFTKIAIVKHYAKWNTKVDRTRWEMPAHMVNAYYNPSFNIIVFPAAILQPPFYSLKQSSSENYGGIGAVIAHEISHAFDNNGAQFDEKGNLHNWWTEADLKHFQQLSEDMTKLFDGLETRAGKVNGKLVVSENIADAGGLSCALEAAKTAGDVDLAAFFCNWARVWGLKSTLEREQLLLNIDVHAPNVLRANIQVQNLPEFYDTFGVTAADGMWLEPSKRVQIW